MLDAHIPITTQYPPRQRLDPTTLGFLRRFGFRFPFASCWMQVSVNGWMHGF
jgi:hypothetical protein